MVQAMVETYAKDSDSTTQQVHEKVEMDLVRGKGKGCIILLHGAPGVGKTSTAECVAVYTKRPLYPITCGDIGYLPEAVEKNMERHFKLAHKWGCVLLLDEADVFLAKRSKEDIKRNGLVSVFLRILEYYSGILFLTTNRVGAIDDAFRSRLHLTLYYPKLTKKQTIKIWERNLEHMKSVNEERKGMGQLAITYKRKAILEFVEKNWKVLSWNGRQIRNAFQTAIALGEFKAKSDTSELETKSPSLSIRQFKIIATASVQFNHYLRETHGVDEDTVAKRDMIRSVKDSIKVKFKGDTSDESESSSDGSDDDAEDESEEGNANNSEDISDSDEKAKNVKKRSKKASKIKSTSSKEKIKDRKRK
ncbi:P-loop containing nucleoside triphosphate hydrolase protein [Rhexocercosporidium sp. MPI-PUGE-AT-0058]|nr:P-loop containing nucleoside triphosphate hydrolase protein [Rhexocercosporidium sp. MPI-PUGE-AT-0058]